MDSPTSKHLPYSLLENAAAVLGADEPRAFPRAPTNEIVLWTSIAISLKRIADTLEASNARKAPVYVETLRVDPHKDGPAVIPTGIGGLEATAYEMHESRGPADVVEGPTPNDVGSTWSPMIGDKIPLTVLLSDLVRVMSVRGSRVTALAGWIDWSAVTAWRFGHSSEVVGWRKVHRS